jgi:prepilin-type N-terminal cleavage/methylation domain-containing protein
MHHHQCNRPGFTLIELLVVLSLILVMAGITVLFMPTALDQTRASEGGAQLQSFVIMAQQRAMLDRVATGVRLQVPPQVGNPPPPAYVTVLQLIQRPDDLTGYQPTGASDPTPARMITSSDTDANGNPRLNFTGVDFTGGATDPTLFLVQVNDYIYVQGGTGHRIINVTSNTLSLSTPLSQPVTTATADYRIKRAPRITGDEPLVMPENIAVDVGTNLKYGSLLPPGPGNAVDILFSPFGEVLGNTGSDRLILWVRDVTLSDGQNPELNGSPTLIVIAPRSGSIAAYPVNGDPNYPGGPYVFVK